MAESSEVCPKCHLAIRAGQPWTLHEGKRYHRDCVPPSAEADKGNVTEDGPIFI
ncbi:MAG: hypothetical protein ACRD1C_14395 [Terriglobales bacterium]